MIDVFQPLHANISAVLTLVRKLRVLAFTNEYKNARNGSMQLDMSMFVVVFLKSEKSKSINNNVVLNSLSNYVRRNDLSQLVQVRECVLCIREIPLRREIL